MKNTAAEYRKIVATTVMHTPGGDNQYHAMKIYRDGHMEIFGHEGAGSYRREEPVAINAAQNWGIYYIPARDAVEQSHLERICTWLAKCGPAVIPGGFGENHGHWQVLKREARDGHAVSYRAIAD